MRVLFVSSGNVAGFGVVPFIKEQGVSLQRLGVMVEYFPVTEKGFRGYVKAGLRLRRYLKHESFDLIHAHFTLSGYVALMGARGTPIVLSLMGSDAYGEYVGENKVQFSSRLLTVLTYLIQPFVKAIISKANNIEQYVFTKKKSFIIPNGINLEKFGSNGINYRGELKLKLDPDKRYILFLGSQDSIRKNISLVSDALALLQRHDVELINPYPVSHEKVPQYLSCVDVFVLCSFMEGSPNVVKEAMACNCPIVATDVGDVKWVLGDVPGCYVASFRPDNFAAKLNEAIKFSITYGKTKGAERIKRLGLDSQTVAERILSVYQKVIQ